MLYKIEHKTTYTYSKEVFLEPHLIRLRPRSDAYQTLKIFDILFNPEPTGYTHIKDMGGDSIFIWFDDMTSSLEIKCMSEVETLLANPFNYILGTERAQRLPMEYSGPSGTVLEHFRSPAKKFGDSFEGFVAKILLNSENSSLNFLSTLTSHIYENFEHEIREDGPAQEPEETLSRMKGSCRDFVVLFNQTCRSMGFAARFVSGYTEGDPLIPHNHLHAWSEVYLPGGGWRGYDPTLGLAVADQHIALCSGATPIEAAPITGSFRGTGVSAKMEYDLSITT